MSSDSEREKAERFESIVMPHLDAAYNLARWITRREEAADEAVQEAYLRAYRYFDSFTGGDGRVWLLAIVRNCCLSSYRRQKGVEVAFDERAHTVQSGELTPEQTLLKKDATRSVRHCIDALPREFREVLVMREIEGLSYKEIADVMGVPMGTVMSSLSRARQKMREQLAESARKEA